MAHKMRIANTFGIRKDVHYSDYQQQVLWCELCAQRRIGNLKNALNVKASMMQIPQQWRAFARSELTFSMVIRGANTNLKMDAAGNATGMGQYRITLKINE